MIHQNTFIEKKVIPAPKEEVPVRKRSLQKTTSFQNSNSVNMNIFSDQNAETFDQFIKSNHNDYKRFNFKFGQSDQVENTEWGNMFDFKQVYVTNSFAICCFWEKSMYVPGKQSFF